MDIGAYRQARSSIPHKIPLLNLLFESCHRLKVHLCTPACVMSSEFACEVVMNFYQLSFCDFDVIIIVLKAILSIISKIFQTDRIQRSYRNKFTTHYICKNADLNLILVEATTNINFFMESWGWGEGGVCLTWFYCKGENNVSMS